VSKCCDEGLTNKRGVRKGTCSRHTIGGAVTGESFEANVLSIKERRRRSEIFTNKQRGQYKTVQHGENQETAKNMAPITRIRARTHTASTRRKLQGEQLEDLQSTKDKGRVISTDEAEKHPITATQRNGAHFYDSTPRDTSQSAKAQDQS